MISGARGSECRWDTHGEGRADLGVRLVADLLAHSQVAHLEADLLQVELVLLARQCLDAVPLRGRVEDVLDLQVPVHDPLLVQVRDALQDLPDDVHHQLLVELLLRPLEQLVQPHQVALA